MTTRLVLPHWDDWLEPGSPSDSRLFHADASDRILVCPAHFGQGYFQEILLRDDLSLIIYDYILNQDLMTDIQCQGDLLEFDFPLTGPGAKYGFLLPYFGLRDISFKQAQKRFFKVEVFFKRPTLITYLQAVIERLSPQNQSIAKRILQSMYRYHGGGSSSTLIGMLNRIFDCSAPPDPYFSFKQFTTDALYTDALDVGHATRSVRTPAMEQVLGQILSCPYRGATRRTYLEHKALELVSLHLEAMVQARVKEVEYYFVYQAAAILKTRLTNPPSVEALARQVGTNRLYLNRGFQQVYGITPYSYSRGCRLWQAQRLLITSDLSIGQVAAAVGYTNCSHFAGAFRQQTGLNPKSFQLQAWQWAS